MRAAPGQRGGAATASTALTGSWAWTTGLEFAGAVEAVEQVRRRARGVRGKERRACGWVGERVGGAGGFRAGLGALRRTACGAGLGRRRIRICERVAT